jgi:hypothetical protein
MFTERKYCRVAAYLNPRMQPTRSAALRGRLMRAVRTNILHGPTDFERTASSPKETK